MAEDPDWSKPNIIPLLDLRPFTSKTSIELISLKAPLTIEIFTLLTPFKLVSTDISFSELFSPLILTLLAPKMVVALSLALEETTATPALFVCVLFTSKKPFPWTEEGS